MPKLNAVCAHSTRGLTQQPREVAQVEVPIATAVLRPPGASGPLVAVVYSRSQQAGFFPGLTHLVSVIPGHHERADCSLCRCR